MEKFTSLLPVSEYFSEFLVSTLSKKKHMMTEEIEVQRLKDVPKSEVLDMYFECERVRKMEAGSTAEKECSEISEKLFHVSGNFIFSRLKKLE